MAQNVKFDDLDSDTVEEIEDKLSSRLYFSNIEHMLLTCYLINFFDMVIIVIFLFKKWMVITEKVKKDYRKVRVMKNVYDRYIETLKIT